MKTLLSERTSGISPVIFSKLFSQVVRMWYLHCTTWQSSTWSIHSFLQTTGKLICWTFVSEPHLRCVLACNTSWWLTGRYLSKVGKCFAKLSVSGCKQYPQKQQSAHSFAFASSILLEYSLTVPSLIIKYFWARPVEKKYWTSVYNRCASLIYAPWLQDLLRSPKIYWDLQRFIEIS